MEEKKNFICLEKLFHIANSAVIQKIRETIPDTNLTLTHLDTPDIFLNSLSTEHKELIYCPTGMLNFTLEVCTCT